MNELIFQLHSPEELLFLSSLGHWIAGYIFLGVSILALLQMRGFYKTRKYLWQSLIVIAGLIFIPYTFLHHSLNEFGTVLQVVLLDPQQKQHIIMFILLFIAGLSELLLSINKIKGNIWRFVFPGVLLIISLMFLFHPQHGTKEALAYSIPFHVALGIVIMLTSISKCLEVLWASRYRFVAYFWIFFLFMTAILLITFNEPEGTYETDKIHESSTGLTNAMEDKISSSFIDSLRFRTYTGGDITIEDNLGRKNTYESYLISYQSDNLKIYGIMNVPDGDPPSNGFPVIILNHGYFNQSSFTSGDGTQTMADILARNGYITLASDYRGFGKSENDNRGSRGHRPEYAIDVLNLIASVDTLDKADKNKIGMWGHSMGGEVALRTVEATDKLKTLVLWAPTSGRVSDNARFYGGGGRTQTSGDSDIEGASPINFLQYISTPIALHQGLADTEVNPDWSKELNKALQKEGKLVEYFEYPGQDHNFRNLGWDEISKRTIEFFDRYLKSS